MKRVACFLLVALMLVAGSASAGEKDYAAMLEQQKAEGLLHLWDIPFGITIDEFAKLVEIPIPFIEDTDEEGISRGCTFFFGLDTGKAHRIEGYEAFSMSAFFYDYNIVEGKGYVYDDTSKEGLREIKIMWNTMDIKDSRELSLMYTDILSNLTDKFGKYAHFHIHNFNDDKERDFLLVDASGKLNVANLMEAMKQKEPMIVDFHWKNAEYRIGCGNVESALLWLTIQDRAWEE